MYTSDLVWSFPLDPGTWQENATLAGFWALAIGVWIVRGRLLRRYPADPPRRVDIGLAVLTLVLFIAGGLGAAGVGQDHHRRQVQQAEYLAQRWGITVVDIDHLPGLTVVQGVRLGIRSSDPAGGKTQRCTLSSFFGTRDGWVTRKPGRGGGDGTMLFRLSCPAAFTG